MLVPFWQNLFGVEELPLRPSIAAQSGKRCAASRIEPLKQVLLLAGRGGRRLLCRCIAGRLLWRSGLVAFRLSCRRSGCRIAARLCRSSTWGPRNGGLIQACRIIPLQLEIDGRHFQRHLVAGVHGRIHLGVQHMHLVVSWIGLETAAQRQSRNLGQVVPIDLRRTVSQVGHPRGSVRFQ